MVPPAVLQFRKWLTIWSGESAKLQDANEKKRYAAILEGGLNGRGAPARKPKSSKDTAKEKRRLQKRQKWQAMTQPGAEERSEGGGSSAEETEV